MTKKGYKTVLIPESSYNKLKKIAEKLNLSLCKTLNKIVEEYMDGH